MFLMACGAEETGFQGDDAPLGLPLKNKKNGVMDLTNHPVLNIQVALKELHLAV